MNAVIPNNNTFKGLKIPLYWGILIRLALIITSTIIFDETSPITSFKRLKEGIFLFQNGINPYDGGSFHQAPLLLLMGYLPDWLIPFLFVLVDYFIAIALVEISKVRVEEQLQEVWKEPLLALDKDVGSSDIVGEVDSEEDSQFEPPVKKYKDPNVNVDLISKDFTKPIDELIVPYNIGTMYLLSPLSIMSCLSKSTQLFSNFGVILAILFSIKGYRRAAVFSLAWSCYQTLYPILILAPMILFLKKASKESV